MTFPATANFPATAVFSHIPPFVTNVQKLSLPANTPVGTRVQVTDGFVTRSFQSPGQYGPGTFFAQWEGSAGIPQVINGKAVYTPISGDYGAENHGLLFYAYSGTRWANVDAGEDSIQWDTAAYAAVGNEVGPWAADWTNTYGFTNSEPGFIFTHPAVQQLAAPSTEQGGVFVAGGTQDGIYVKGDPEFAGNSSRQMFVLLGHENQYSNWSLYWDDINSEWYFYDSDGGQLYYSESDVATPDLATNWKNASDDSPASITVTNVTHGELDAGMVLNNVFYQVNGNANGRNRFSDVLGVQPSIYFNGTIWTDGTTTSDDETAAFIWNGAGDLAGDRTNVCSEANWNTI